MKNISSFVYAKDKNGEWNILIYYRGINKRFFNLWSSLDGISFDNECVLSGANRIIEEISGLNIEKCVRNTNINKIITSDSFNTEDYKVIYIIYDVKVEQMEPKNEEDGENVIWFPVRQLYGLKWHSNDKKLIDKFFHKYILRESFTELIKNFYRDLKDELRRINRGFY